MRCRVEFWQKSGGVSLERRGQEQLREEWTRRGFDGRMFRCRGNPSAASVSSAQQCASDSPDPTQRESERKKNRNYDFIFIPVFLFTTSSSLCSSSHPSIVSARLSSLISVCSLHFPWQVLDLRLQLRLLIFKLQGIKMKFFPLPKTDLKEIFDLQWKIHIFNAIAYQFFAGSRLHVVGIRISVLQCVTTLWREQIDSVSVWKPRPLCINLWACRRELQVKSK